MGDSPDCWLVGDENGGHIEFDGLKVIQASRDGWTTIPLYTSETLRKRMEQVRQDERKGIVLALRGKFGVTNRAADFITREATS